jgi:hypothetical protein
MASVACVALARGRELGMMPLLDTAPGLSGG